MPKREHTAVVAVGGNSLIVDDQHQSIPDQVKAATMTSHYVADMVEAGWTVVLTHGNGPQVGFILRRSGIAKGMVPEVPVDYADADTQGAIGYMFQRALYNEFQRRKLKRKVVAIVTQVLVDPGDPAFRNPTKPIGAHMTEDVAKSLAEDFGWVVKEDAGRGWRRVVASPMPKQIIERDIIEALIDLGYIVIACGGGGIPVLRDAQGDLQGLEAVIDKDFASSLLARDLGAELFVVSTGVEKVAVDFGKPTQRWLERITLADVRKYFADGQFPKGSMGPKIEAIISFLEGGGTRALITNPPNLGRALSGATGTHIVPA
ncbi:MAG TPA: carbamate kinase [Burkholderiales bacterium]|nr:carbamate kinase [Burkholderiales bacterium]